MVSSHGQFSITNSLLTLTMQNPLISTVASYQSVNLDYQRDRETYPNEERVAGRSPARSTAKRGALRLRDLSQRGYSLQELKKNPVFMHWGFYFAKS